MSKEKNTIKTRAQQNAENEKWVKYLQSPKGKEDSKKALKEMNDALATLD